jgi:thymidine phosphorylase
VVDHPDRLPRASVRLTVEAPAEGILEDVNPRDLGNAVVELGGGRRRAEDPVDPGVGILLHRTRGEAVRAGEPLATILARSEQEGSRVVRDLVAGAFRIGRNPPGAGPRIRTLVTSRGTHDWNGGGTWSAARGK